MDTETGNMVTELVKLQILTRDLLETVDGLSVAGIRMPYTQARELAERADAVRVAIGHESILVKR